MDDETPRYGLDSCPCWKAANNTLADKKLQLSSTLVAKVRQEKGEEFGMFVLPLRQLGGKPTNKDQPAFVRAPFCPMCGGRYNHFDLTEEIPEKIVAFPE